MKELWEEEVGEWSKSVKLKINWFIRKLKRSFDDSLWKYEKNFGLEKSYVKLVLDDFLGTYKAINIEFDENGMPRQVTITKASKKEVAKKGWEKTLVDSDRITVKRVVIEEGGSGKRHPGYEITYRGEMGFLTLFEIESLARLFDTIVIATEARK